MNDLVHSGVLLPEQNQNDEQSMNHNSHHYKVYKREPEKRVVERMISIGYPEQFKDFKYDPVFPVRGLWLDKLYGNLLKVDGFGNILVAIHGFRFMTGSEIEKFYPNKFIHLTEQRIFVLNTLFNLPETFLIASVVDYFDNHPDYESTQDRTGLRTGDVLMSYKSIFQDIRNAFDWAHFDGDLKNTMLKNLEEYIEKDDRLELLLKQLSASGRKTFLLTNSEYYYTEGVMKYLLGPDWTSYFDITVVDAQKPRWFAEGTVFRGVNRKTGDLKIGIHTGSLVKGEVYSGGSCDAFKQLVKARGKDVLYIGDHIFGDVLRSKKTRGWRTFLVIPELNRELAVWTGRPNLFQKLQELESLMADLYKDLDANTTHKPQIDNVLKNIQEVTNNMEQEYSVLGSLFRRYTVLVFDVNDSPAFKLSGSRTTFFAAQAERYADLYASNCCNLINYPIFYFFRAPMTLMPHESTVHHTDMIPSNMEPLIRHDSVSKQVRGWNEKISKSTAICFDEEDEDDESRIASARTLSRTDRYDAESLNSQNSATNEPLTTTDVIAVNSGYVDMVDDERNRSGTIA